jgi:hypothetical protein
MIIREIIGAHHTVFYLFILNCEIVTDPDHRFYGQLCSRGKFLGNQE